MRMWLINPKIMCNKHLLGEHVEMHMFVGTINKNKSINGYIKKGLVETGLISKRHEELVREMKKRGFNHKSELIYSDNLNVGKVDVKQNIIELKKRCIHCRKRQKIHNLKND